MTIEIRNAIIYVVIAYLLGSINFAVIFSKIFMKKDVREVGSGNAGATNVLRSVGVLPGLLTFLFDALKGFIASYFGKVMFEMMDKLEPEKYAIIGAYVCGLACMLGHVFPIFFKFKGGKGVATSVGIFAVCNPLAITLGLVVFAVVLILSKIVSLSSLIATVTVVVLSIIFYDFHASILPQAILIIIMGAVVFIKHKDNIERLISGSENKIGGKKNG
ncbi:MAG: glycerol-3-phosphate 1-O-acyltransferase PlsY [Clostridia bacterium]|nr:glycerol-3-phosphate 1-O-acyltransferase PlsY [Clostridia bacterium]